MNLILEMRRLRHKVVKGFAQGCSGYAYSVVVACPRKDSLERSPATYISQALNAAMKLLWYPTTVTPATGD